MSELNWDKPLQTRDGREVKHLYKTNTGHHVLVITSLKTGNEEIVTTLSGMPTINSDCDIINVDERAELINKLDDMRLHLSETPSPYLRNVAGALQKAISLLKDKP